MEIKRIMRYLKGTEEYGLWYKLKGNLDLEVFIDANLEVSIDEKNTSGGAFFLGKRLVS